jgi:hypothetical protein
MATLGRTGTVIANIFSQLNVHNSDQVLNFAVR